MVLAFNSLSRDHGKSAQFVEKQGTEEAFNSLSRDHRYIGVSGDKWKVSFQLPLSGSLASPYQQVPEGQRDGRDSVRDPERGS